MRHLFQRCAAKSQRQRPDDASADGLILTTLPTNRKGRADAHPYRVPHHRPRSGPDSQGHRRICGAGELSDDGRERRPYAEPSGVDRTGANPQFDKFTIVLKGVLRVEPSTLPFVCRRFRRTSSAETHITFNVRVGDAGRHPLPE
jgi:hypothetical protein